MPTGDAQRERLVEEQLAACLNRLATELEAFTTRRADSAELDWDHVRRSQTMTARISNP